MILKSILLQNFRNYSKAQFNFSLQTTIIVGPNAVGKSNIIEALFLLSTGKSFRTDKDRQLIQFGKSVSRLKGIIEEAGPVELLSQPTSSHTLRSLAGEIPPLLSRRAPSLRSVRSSPLATRDLEQEELEIVYSETPTQFLQKKYLINGVSKRRADFKGRIQSVLFTPEDLDLVSGQPGNRRKYLDEILEQIDTDYSSALSSYVKALRQRNALLDQAQKTGIRSDKVFAYWDELLIKNGQIISKKRQEFINYINNRKKEIFDFNLIYDSSIISEERLTQYKQAEVGAGVTLVGPHRDDVIIKAPNKLSGKDEEVRYFGSRGQQRLVSLELKLSHIAIINERTGEPPLLLLDDIFSELDEKNISHVMGLMNIYQTIATTTHKEFVGKKALNDLEMIELGK
jgi:DNA replication and repair protein RecF